MTNIELRRLTSDYYSEHAHLKEAMDFDKVTRKPDDKGRGFGVCLVDILGHQFAIPLRTTMYHKENFPTKFKKDDNGRVVREGLDYSKAVIITDQRFISSTTFETREKEEYLKINGSEKKILRDFEKYIKKYIKAVKKPDENILKEYKYSTLQNYHAELGLD